MRFAAILISGVVLVVVGFATPAHAQVRVDVGVSAPGVRARIVTGAPMVYGPSRVPRPVYVPRGSGRIVYVPRPYLMPVYVPVRHYPRGRAPGWDSRDWASMRRVRDGRRDDRDDRDDRDRREPMRRGGGRW